MPTMFTKHGPLMSFVDQDMLFWSFTGIFEGKSLNCSQIDFVELFHLTAASLNKTQQLGGGLKYVCF